MPITSEQLAKRLVIAAKSRRDIRKTTLALIKFGKLVIKKHTKSSPDNNSEE